MTEARAVQKPTPIDLNRTVVIGNTASGKSWLSGRLGKRLSSPVVDLDRIHWINGDYRRKEKKVIAVEKTQRAAEREKWIIEGVYGALISPIIDRATCLIWTDIPWSECRRNLFSRASALGSLNNIAELEVWAENYWRRNSESSYGAHLRLFEGFNGPKFRLKNMDETSCFAQDIETS
ncbi:hypothetical protein [Vannielia sp. SX4]|uniref:hypothetical protein n=1 Tax=Vannielia sp. SX4 TaxID=3463852 RepID=UPI0040587F45